MADFLRKLDSRILEKLKKDNLFNTYLLRDIQKGVVFPSIRNNYLDFYYAGRLLFSYDRDGFKTHIKYASVLDVGKRSSPYVRQDEIKSLKPIDDFHSGYERIKENCKNYAGIEGEGVSYLYSYSFVQSCPIVVLDIEVAFSGDESSEKRTDRIDLLLFNKEEATLRFIEAKHYSNQEISGEEPKVLKQMNRYMNTLKKKEKKILEQYERCINLLNELFNLELPEQINLDKQSVALYVFGFDNDQNLGGVKEMKKIMKKNSISLYTLGGYRKIDSKALWIRTS